MFLANAMTQHTVLYLFRYDEKKREKLFQVAGGDTIFNFILMIFGFRYFLS